VLFSATSRPRTPMRLRRKVISQIYGGNGTTYAND
jgi:hypothetical protein